MCLETDFLRWGDRYYDSSPHYAGAHGQYNFAHLGIIGAGELATFPNLQLGVRAHVQHLKAYASTEPLVQGVVDPRFLFVRRGIAPLVDQLSGRWRADTQYGAKIMALVRRLYESAGLL